MPPSPSNENSPVRTLNSRVGVSVAAPHDTLTSTSFAIVKDIAIRVSGGPSAKPVQVPLKLKIVGPGVGEARRLLRTAGCVRDGDGYGSHERHQRVECSFVAVPPSDQ
jgi:hypothetical protein